MSDSGNLLTALLAFQRNAPTLSRDSENPHFHNRYVSLDAIMQKVTPLLSDQGLLWIALPCIENSEPALRYRLVHAESGEVIEGVMPLMLGKQDSQGQGSALTYARRYAISAVLGLSAEDDDGQQAASGRQRASAPAAARQGNGAQAAEVQPTERLASAKQRGLIMARASELTMPASFLANLINIAMGAEPREFQDEDAARNYLQRALDRLPASKVDKVLENIAAEAV